MPHDFMPGLAGVPAARSQISDVDGKQGLLEYPGIRVEEPFAKSTLLETSLPLPFHPAPDTPHPGSFSSRNRTFRTASYTDGFAACSRTAAWRSDRS